MGSCFGVESERGPSVWESTAVRFSVSAAGCPVSPLILQGHWDELRHLLQPADKRNLRIAQQSPSFLFSLWPIDPEEQGLLYRIYMAIANPHLGQQQNGSQGIFFP